MAKRSDDESGETTPAPDPWAVMSQIANALEAISRKQEAAPDDRLMAMQEKLSVALERLADAQVESGKLIASETRRAHRPSNEVVPGISVFNRRGVGLPDDAQGPRKRPLACIMLLPWLAEWESLTREEVDLLNLLVKCPGQYEAQKIDKSKIRMDVLVEYKLDSKTPSRMLVNHETAFNNDNFKMMPPLVDWVRHILKQTDMRKEAAAVMTDEEEEALIEAGELTTAA